MNRIKKVYCGVSFIVGLLAVVLTLVLLFNQNVSASETENNTTTNEGTGTGADTNNNAGLHINVTNDSGQLSGNLRILIFLTIITLAPSILIMMTSFTRIIVVLHFLRTALGTQTSPPNQVLVGLALFLTLFIMTPVFTEINDTALKPLDENKITQEEAIENALIPMREFMYSQTQNKDLKLFCDIAEIDLEAIEDVNEIPISVVIPSFIISELRSAFIMGFLIYIPFIVIDMVVASVLMSMGMMMLPPATISMPFKILLFIMADGWELLIGNLVKTFY